MAEDTLNLLEVASFARSMEDNPAMNNDILYSLGTVQNCLCLSQVLVLLEQFHLVSAHDADKGSIIVGMSNEGLQAQSQTIHSQYCPGELCHNATPFLDDFLCS